MNNPEYIKIDDKEYKLNTDYRYVIKFQKLIKDNSISDYERILGIIYLFYGDEGINNTKDYERLLNGVLNFIQGRPNSYKKKMVENKKSIKDMDYEEDWGLIMSSMYQQYGININNEKIHWWTFYDLLNGLSSDCILNTVRNIRTKDLSKIKDKEERETYAKLKREWSLEQEQEPLSEKQQRSVDRFYELTGIDRK